MKPYRLLLIFIVAVIALSCGSKQGSSKQPRETRGLFPIVQNGKWGFIDKTGAIKIKPQFDSVMVKWGCPVANFSEGLNVVKVGDRFGYIDEQGRFAINPQFHYAGPFSEGLAMASTDDNTGFIDKTGRFVIQAQFDRQTYNTQKEGHYFIPGANPSYEEDGFNNGLAPVRMLDNSSNGEVIFIDKAGKRVMGPFFSGRNFSEGFAAVSSGIGRHFFVNSSGNPQFNATYEDVGDFSEGLAEVKIGEKSGYIDRSGTLVIPPQFEGAHRFQEGLACVGVGKYPNKKFGFIDKTGKFIINPTLSACGGYAGLGDFSNGLVEVKIEENGTTKFVYIDTTGIIIIRPTGHPCPFADGLAGVKEDGKFGYIDTSGKFVWPLSK